MDFLHVLKLWRNSLLTVNTQISISFCPSAVVRDFAVLEDHCLAHNLQEQESKLLYNLYFFNIHECYCMESYDLVCWSCLLTLNESFKAFFLFLTVLLNSGTKSPNLASPFAAMWGFTPSPEITSICILLALVCENDPIENASLSSWGHNEGPRQNVDGC